MLIATSEGQGWRYEVVDRAEGYLVVPRDLDTGAVEPEGGMLFRTAPMAFAFAARIPWLGPDLAPEGAIRSP